MDPGHTRCSKEYAVSGLFLPWAAYSFLNGGVDMATKPSPAERAAEIFDLPAESVAGVPKLTITGCRYAVVENHRGITTYSRELIEVDGGRVHLRIRGEALELTAMDRSVLIIRGQIYAAEFE